jgi:hypothetical protein
VLDKAKDVGAIPYDIIGAEYPITPTSVHLISFLKNISCLTPLFFNGKIVRGPTRIVLIWHHKQLCKYSLCRLSQLKLNKKL